MQASSNSVVCSSSPIPREILTISIPLSTHHFIQSATFLLASILTALSLVDNEYNSQSGAIPNSLDFIILAHDVAWSPYEITLSIL